MKYQDITEQYTSKKKYQIKKQKYFIDDDGIKYNVDGKYVILKPTRREIEVAELLGQAIGGKINIIPRINKPCGIKTPDYIINNERFDLKKITSKRRNDCVKTSLRNQEKQANNFIIDNTAQTVSDADILKQIDEIYNSKGFLWINKIYLLKDDKFIKIFKRK